MHARALRDGPSTSIHDNLVGPWRRRVWDSKVCAEMGSRFAAPETLGIGNGKAGIGMGGGLPRLHSRAQKSRTVIPLRAVVPTQQEEHPEAEAEPH